VTSEPTFLSVEKSGEVTVISFHPEHRVFNRSDIDSIGDQLNDVVDPLERQKIIISFEGVEYVSSAVLGTLVSCLLRVQKSGGQLKLACVGENLEPIFRLTTLDRIFDIYPGVDEALKSFG